MPQKSNTALTHRNMPALICHLQFPVKKFHLFDYYFIYRYWVAT